MADEILLALAQLDGTSSASPFWRDRIGEPDLGFRCSPLRGPTNRNERMADALEAAERIRKLSKAITAERRRFGKSDLAIYSLWMQDRGVYDEIMDFLDAQGLEFNSGAIRWYLYAKRIAEMSEPDARLIEIGGGAGETACFAHTLRPWRLYVAVDLPPMLANLCRNLSQRLPTARFVLNEWPTEDSAEPTVVLVDPDHVDVIPDDTMDWGLNFNSFMEMDRDIRDGYIALLYRVLRPGGIFWHVNRRENGAHVQRDGSFYDNHPLLYPYRTDDEVIDIDLDYSQVDPRSAVGSCYHRLTISRMARVKQGPVD